MDKEINRNKKFIRAYELIINKNHENYFSTKNEKAGKTKIKIKLLIILFFKFTSFILLFIILLIILKLFFPCISKNLIYSTNQSSYNESIFLHSNISGIPERNIVKFSSTVEKLTIVSALFDVDAKKRDFNLYYEWSENLFTLNTPIVFFVDPKIANKVKSLRPKEYDNITAFIEMNLTDFYSYKKYYNDIVDFKKKNPSFYRARYRPELYVIWSEKINFVKIAIEKNYFNSKYFAWVDAGYLRNKKKSEMPKYKNWPHLTRRYKGSRVKITNVQRKYKKEIFKLLMDFNISLLFEEKFRVAGGIFFGRWDIFLKLHNKYYKVVDEFKKRNIFFAQEEPIFGYIGIIYPEIIEIVYPKKENDFRFFQDALIKEMRGL